MRFRSLGIPGSLLIALACGVGGGCLAPTEPSSPPVMNTPAPAPSPSFVPVYCAVAVSGGFNRNDAWAVRCGTYLQGTIDAANITCQEYARGVCDDVFWCGPPDLVPSTPWLAIARAPVSSPSYVARGVTGISCGHPNEAVARSTALSVCGLRECQVVWSGRVSY